LAATRHSKPAGLLTQMHSSLDTFRTGSGLWVATETPEPSGAETAFEGGQPLDKRACSRVIQHCDVSDVLCCADVQMMGGANEGKAVVKVAKEDPFPVKA
jgi:hypothetical protein